MKNMFMVGIALCTAVVSLCAQETMFPDIQGWKCTPEEKSYDANNLWDIIDGAADLYLLYGFQDLHIVRYMNADSAEIKIELYRHSTSTNAFGMYSQERDTAYHFIEMGTEGYMQDGVLNFLTGTYYIKLSTFQSGEPTQKAMRMLAQEIDAKLNQKHEIPAELQYFPAEGRIPHTEQYVAQSFLGYSFLNNVFTASCRLENQTYRMFLIASTEKKAADLILNAYTHAVGNENITPLGNGVFKIHDVNNGYLVAAVVDRFFCGVVCSEDLSNTHSVDAIIARLPVH